MRHLLAALVLACLVAPACTSGTSMSPNDPNYARNGAPRVGAPGVQDNNPYGRLQGNDNSGSK